MNNQHLTALSTSRAWAEISADALIHNARLFSPESRNGIMAVVKANAYGHGAVPVGRILSRAGVRHFCVATLAEGMELRSAGISGEIPDPWLHTAYAGRTDPGLQPDPDGH